VERFNLTQSYDCTSYYIYIYIYIYNEQSGWTEAHERALLELLDDVNAKGIKFALSNVLENKGKSNDILRAWSQKYNIYHLNHTYGNCSYHAKDKSSGSTDEVLITNY